MSETLSFGMAVLRGVCGVCVCIHVRTRTGPEGVTNRLYERLLAGTTLTYWTTLMKNYNQNNKNNISNMVIQLVLMNVTRKIPG